MVPGGLSGAPELLRCPVCGARVEVAGTTLRCPSRHTFDVSRHGYVSLLGGRRAVSGDDDEMARARERFLSTGAYAPLRDAVVGAALTARRLSSAAPGTAGRTMPAVRAAAAVDPPLSAGTPDPVVLDVGAGTGYYLAGALDAVPTARGVALDTSVRALRVAARSHPRTLAATWDAFETFPVPAASVDVVLDVFSPRNPAEFARVLRPDGRLVVARPTVDHLAELRHAVPGMVAIDPAKEERLARALDPLFVPERTWTLERSIDLTPAQARDLIGMTPSARHLDVAALAGTGPSPEHVVVTISVLVTAYAPRP